METSADVTSTNHEVREQFDRDRQHILNDLYELRMDIDNDLALSEKRLAEMDPDSTVLPRHQLIHGELLHQRSALEQHIENVENAGMDDWENLRMETLNGMNEAQLMYEREGLERGIGGVDTGSPLY